jgi:hypothetical protein
MKGNACPFVVNVNGKENTREPLLVVGVKQYNHNKENQAYACHYNVYSYGDVHGNFSLKGNGFLLF